MFLSFDIMGNVGFGKEFNNLSTGVEHPGIKAVHDHMAILGTMGHIPWLLNIISHLPGATSAMAEFFKWCEDEVVQKHQVRHGLKLSKYQQSADIILTCIMDVELGHQ